MFIDFLKNERQRLRFSVFVSICVFVPSFEYITIFVYARQQKWACRWWCASKYAFFYSKNDLIILHFLVIDKWFTESDSNFYDTTSLLLLLPLFLTSDSLLAMYVGSHSVKARIMIYCAQHWTELYASTMINHNTEI